MCTPNERRGVLRDHTAGDGMSLQLVQGEEMVGRDMLSCLAAVCVAACSHLSCL